MQVKIEKTTLHNKRFVVILPPRKGYPRENRVRFSTRKQAEKYAKEQEKEFYQ